LPAKLYDTYWDPRRAVEHAAGDCDVLLGSFAAAVAGKARKLPTSRR